MKPNTYSVHEHLASCRLTIDHQALCDNWRSLNEATPGARTAGVVKANGYGLGLGEVGQTLEAAGCDAFFVANVDEGIRLRKCLNAGEIFVFSGITRQNAGAYAEAGLIPVLNTLDDIAVWSEYWKLRGSRRPCAVQIDSGMNRMGLKLCDIEKLQADTSLFNSVTIITVISHLACADEPNHPMNREQLERFKSLATSFEGSELSLSNSAGIGLGSEYHFNMVRPGIALYGGECSVTGKPEMQVVAQAEARIVQVHQAEKGEVIGYGASHQFTRDSIIATVSAGYADGYLRTGSEGIHKPGAFGFIGGHRVPVLGRISMDYTAFDVTDVPEQVLADHQYIELFGNNIKLDDAARAAGTIGYEILTSIGQRYHRNHINHPEST